MTIYDEIAAERQAQDDKWGQQNHQDLPNPQWVCRIMAKTDADELKARNEANAKLGKLNWLDILMEEVFEAVAEEDPAKLRAELVQATAVIVAWIEAIDRRVQSGQGKSLPN